MIKLKLLILLLIVLGPCALAFVKKGQSVGRTLPAALCAQTLALIAMGAALPFSVSLGVVAAVSAGMWAYSLVHVRALISKKTIFSFVVPCALLLAALVFLYDACIRRVYLSYDEYSHWGMIVKAISVFDELPRAGRGAPYIQFTYPPSAAILPAVASAVLGYRDGAAYLGYAFLLLGLLYGLSAKAGRGKGTPVACVLIYLAVMVVFPMSILRLFTEPAIALLMALLILGGVQEDTPAWEDCLYAAMLALIKNTGLVFVALALVIRLFVRPGRKEALNALRMLGISLAVVAAYALYCRLQGIEAVISPSHLSENLRALANGTIDPMYLNLPKRFIDFFFGFKLSQSGIYVTYGFATPAAVTALALLMSGVHVCVSQDRRQALRLWGGVWLCNLLYAVMIVASYFTSFEPWEVERLAEADRYTMLILLWTAVLACAMLVHERNTARPKLRIALIAAMAAVLLPLSHMEMTVKTFITREYVDNTLWARDQTERMTAYLKGELVGEKNAKMLCMGEYSYIELHYTMAGDADLGRMDKSWQYAPFTGSCDAVAQELAQGGYDYVFVAGTGSEYPQRVIDERYAPLTADGSLLAPYSLYRVKHGEDGTVVLDYLSSMPKQE